MATVKPHTFGNEILKALGFDNHTIRGFTLRVELHEIPTITCEHIITDDNGELATVLRRYEVHEAEGGENEGG